MRLNVSLPSALFLKGTMRFRPGTPGWIKWELDLVGKEKTIAAVEEAFTNLKGVTRDGLIAGGHIIQRGSQKLAPKDTGNLRASAYTIWPGQKPLKEIEFDDKRGDAERLKAERVAITEANKSEMAKSENEFAVEVGHSAYYAIVQHAVPFEHDVGQWKFLLTSFLQNRNKVRNEIVARFEKFNNRKHRGKWL